jgi:YihY family inner membrane protein
VSTAARVPETYELTGDDARETLLHTGRLRLLRDAFVRLRAADGFSHARSLAYLTSLLLIQGVIALVGVAAALGDRGLGRAITRTVQAAAPGPVGRLLTRGVLQAKQTGTSGRDLAIAFGTIGALITATTLMGQMERALNRLYGVERDRPSLQKYGRAFVMALTAGVLSAASFVMFAFGREIGDTIGDRDATRVWNVARWPIALALLITAMALLFRWAPKRRQPSWSWLAYGAGVSVLLWSVVTLVLGLLLRASSSFGQTYGPLTGIVAMLIWALLSSVGVLYGAAVAAQLEGVRAGVAGPRASPRETAVTAPPPLEPASSNQHMDGLLTQVGGSVAGSVGGSASSART